MTYQRPLVCCAAFILRIALCSQSRDLRLLDTDSMIFLPSAHLRYCHEFNFTQTKNSEGSVGAIE
jgi:hypothetical protein